MTGTGVEMLPTGTLVDRALDYLSKAPSVSAAIVRDVLGIPMAAPFVADRLAVALLGADPRVSRRADGAWELVPRPDRSGDLDQCTFAVVAVETTGSRPAREDRITEIAVVVVRGGPGSAGEVQTIFETLLNPGRPIPPAVTAVTRITNDMVCHQPRFGDVADQVMAALAGRIFVAHNLGFDWRFVSTEVRRACDVALAGPRLCTVRLARRLLPALKSRSLDSVSGYFGVEIENRHRAGDDARATARVLQRLIGLARERDVQTFQELALIGGRGGRKRRRRSALPTWVSEA